MISNTRKDVYWNMGVYHSFKNETATMFFHETTMFFHET